MSGRGSTTQAMTSASSKTDRTMARVLALLPAIVVAVAVRVLTLGQPPLAARLGAAAAIALASWIAYRLLTARVVVDETGLEIRGVFHEGQVLWSEIESVEWMEPAAAVKSTRNPFATQAMAAVLNPAAVPPQARPRPSSA